MFVGCQEETDSRRHLMLPHFLQTSKCPENVIRLNSHHCMAQD